PTVADMVFLALNTPGFKGSQGLNVCIWSDPGEGKTSMVEDVVAKAERNRHVIVLTRVAPEDLTGIPNIIEVPVDARGNPLPPDKAHLAASKMKLTVKVPDARFVDISRDPKAVIILDDATNSTPAVQAAALDILLERKFTDGRGQTVSLKHVSM